MPRNGPPDRWLSYSKVGTVIVGTPFIAFKVPLKEALCQNVEPQERFTPSILMEQYPNLGLVIDLTFTTRYYAATEFLARGVKHCKILCAGHGSTPKDKEVKRFTEVVDNFLEERPSEEKLVGVHCTHGLNRTGFMICRYMIDRMGFSPEQAVKAFEDARGHPIERTEYLECLGYTQPSGRLPARENSDRRSRKNQPFREVQEPPSREVQEQPSNDYEPRNQGRHIPSIYSWSNVSESLSNPYQYDGRSGNVQKGSHQQWQDGSHYGNVQRDSYQQRQCNSRSRILGLQRDSYEQCQDDSRSTIVQRDSQPRNVQKDSYDQHQYNSNSGNVPSVSYQQYQDGSNSGNAPSDSYQQHQDGCHAGNVPSYSYQQNQDGRNSGNVPSYNYQQYQDGSHCGNVSSYSYQQYQDGSNSGNVPSGSYQQHQIGSHSRNVHSGSYQQSPSGYYKRNSDGYTDLERQQKSPFKPDYKKPYNNPGVSNGQQPNRHYRFDFSEDYNPRSSQQEDTTTAQNSCWF